MKSIRDGKMNLLKLCLVLADKAEQEGVSLKFASDILSDISTFKNFLFEHKDVIKKLETGKCNQKAVLENDYVVIDSSYLQMRRMLASGLLIPVLKETVKKKSIFMRSENIQRAERIAYDAVTLKGFVLTNRGSDIYDLILGKDVQAIELRPWGEKDLNPAEYTEIEKGNNFSIWATKADARNDCEKCLKHVDCDGYGHPCTLFQKANDAQRLFDEIKNEDDKKLISDIKRIIDFDHRKIKNKQ